MIASALWVAALVLWWLAVRQLRALSHVLGLGARLIRLQLTFTRAQFARVYDAWQPEERERFRLHFTADYVFLSTYALAGAVTGWAVGVSVGPGPGWLAASMLVLAAVSDAAENVLQAQILAAGPDRAAGHLFPLAGAASAVKWGLSLAFVVVLVLAGFRLWS